MALPALVLFIVFGTVAFLAVVIVVNHHRPPSPVGERRTQASGSDGSVAWMGADSSGSDCAPGDAGSGCDSGGGDSGGGDGGGGGGD